MSNNDYFDHSNDMNILRVGQVLNINSHNTTNHRNEKINKYKHKYTRNQEEYKSSMNSLIKVDEILQEINKISNPSDIQKVIIVYYYFEKRLLSIKNKNKSTGFNGILKEDIIHEEITEHMTSILKNQNINVWCTSVKGIKKNEQALQYWNVVGIKNNLQQITYHNINVVEDVNNLEKNKSIKQNEYLLISDTFLRNKGYSFDEGKKVCQQSFDREQEVQNLKKQGLLLDFQVNKNIEKNQKQESCLNNSLESLNYLRPRRLEL